MTINTLEKVFVTGADGFIGSHLVEKLVKENYDVTALCQYNSSGNIGWISDIYERKAKNLKIILGDVRDPFFIKESIKGHDIVFHLAALIAIPYSYKSPQSYFETNVNGTINVMEACLNTQVKRFIHTSTSEVYGSAQFVPISEQHPLQAQSPYSASKIAADMVVESYFRSYDLPTIILRPFNTYGPRQSMRAVIPTLISQVLSGKKEIKLGSITPTRDFNYVDDTVNAFLEVAKAPIKNVLGNIFNTGTGIEISIKSLAELVEELTLTKFQIIIDEQRVRPNKSEVDRLISNSQKLQNATSWRPTYNLENGLIKLIEWMKDHKQYISNCDEYHT